MKKLKTNFQKWELLTSICEMATHIHKQMHPYSRKKFKPHTITIGDIFVLGAWVGNSIITNEDLEVLHKYTTFLLSKNVLVTKVDSFPTWNIEQWFLKLEANTYIKQ